MGLTPISEGAGPAPVFAESGWLFVPDLIAPALVPFFWSYVFVKFTSLLITGGDLQVPHSPGAYGDPAFDGLLEYLRPKIEALCGLALHPTYSYFRIYKRGDVLAPHTDREACEISVTLNIGQEPADPWPIYLQRDGCRQEFVLQPGEALLYRGCDWEHGRDVYPGDRLVQVFLHYVDRNGPHAALKFDGRKSLMRSSAASFTTNRRGGI